MSFNGKAFLADLVKSKNLTQSLEHTGLGCVHVLRLDTLDKLISGNKAFKLVGHIDAFYASRHSNILSFGGAYSNHLHALGALCYKLSIPVIAYVRGYPDAPLTPTLKDLTNWGVKLKFLDKKDYGKRYDEKFKQQLSSLHNAYVVAEGGGGYAGLEGGKILAKLCAGYQHIWLAAGTGTTALSIAPYLKQDVTLNIVNVVADKGELENKLVKNMPQNSTWNVFNAIEIDELGAFGKCSNKLKEFIKHWDKQDLPLDPVYTAKLLWVYLKQNSQYKNTLIIHSGGLQGRRGLDLTD